MFGAQATGCNPITNTRQDRRRARSSRSATRTRSPRAWPSATRPTATSPRKLIRETGGWGEDVDDDAIVDGMKLLAETEGIFAETAGGVTVAVARKLIEQGQIDRDGSTVLCITGNGLKTQEALHGKVAQPGRHQADAGRVRGPGRPARPSSAAARASDGLIRRPDRRRRPVRRAPGCVGSPRHASGDLPLDHRIPHHARRPHPHPAPSPRRRPRHASKPPGATVGEVLADLGTPLPRAPASGSSTATELRQFVNVYVNNEDIRYLDDLDTAVADQRRGQHHPGHRRGLSRQSTARPVRHPRNDSDGLRRSNRDRPARPLQPPGPLPRPGRGRASGG